MPSTKPTCPHCDQELLPFSLPEAGGWDAPFQLACFNDDCPYYERGWAWMKEHYGVRSSYRYRLDPASRAASPLPVWSPTAMRDRILEADVDVGRPDAGASPEGQKGSES